MSRTKESQIVKAEKRIAEILDRQKAREANRNEKIEELRQMIEKAKEREHQAVINNDEQAFKDAASSRRFAEERLELMNDFNVGLTAEERSKIIDAANTSLAAASLEARTALRPLLDEIVQITRQFHDEAFSFQQEMNAKGFQVNGVTGGAASKEVKAGYEVERMFRF